MSLPIEFDSDARSEFLAAIEWYESKRQGLGLEFLDEVRTVMRLISDSPRMFAQIASGIRQATVKRFPFSVIYRPEPARILVLAVFHGSRDPEAWKYRR
jgi:plasmid stabilization system protein ParE